MGNLIANGIRIHYTEQGHGDETVVFSHSFLASSVHFLPQIEALSSRYRCIAFDHRGHGGSEAPRIGYEIEDIYSDAESFLETLGCAPCHFVGLSTGGFVGLRLAIRRPDLVRSLVLMATSADEEPFLNTQKYLLLGRVVRRVGWRPVLGMVMQNMFGGDFLNDPARRDEVQAWRERFLAMDPIAGAKFGRGIFTRKAVYADLGRIDIPTLVVVGEKDVATPPRRAERIAAAIPKAQLVQIPRAGHLCTVEEPAAVNAALDGFLRQPATKEAAAF